MTVTAMSPALFRQGLDLLDETQVGFAEETGVNPRTVRKWAGAESPIPTWVAKYMALRFRVGILEDRLAKIVTP
jgi:hypothetical protein